MPYFDNDFLVFLQELRENNNKTWFEANRRRYEENVKEPFAAFVAEMIKRVRSLDPSVAIPPKNAIFRIFRDTRFSRDKTPYKTHMSALISATGRKNMEHPGYYFELNPDEVKIYGGSHHLERETLAKVRAYIAKDPPSFHRLIDAEPFVRKFGQIRGERSKRLPPELKEAAEQEPLLYNKEYYFFSRLDGRAVLEHDLADVLMEHIEVGKPINDFLASAMGLQQ